MLRWSHAMVCPWRMHVDEATPSRGRRAQSVLARVTQDFGEARRLARAGLSRRALEWTRAGSRVAEGVGGKDVRRPA